MKRGFVVATILGTSVNVIGVAGVAISFGLFCIAGVGIYLTMRSNHTSDHTRIQTDKENYATKKVADAKEVWAVREQELLATIRDRDRQLGECGVEKIRLQARVDVLSDLYYGRRQSDDDPPAPPVTPRRAH